MCEDSVSAVCSSVDCIQWGGSLVLLSTQLSKAAASATPHCLQLSLTMDPPGPWPVTLTPSSSRVPLLGQQTSEARVIRVSINNNHGNLYRSILVRAGKGQPCLRSETQSLSHLFLFNLFLNYIYAVCM